MNVEFAAFIIRLLVKLLPCTCKSLIKRNLHTSKDMKEVFLLLLFIYRYPSQILVFLNHQEEGR